MAIKTKRMSDWLPLNGEAVTNACKTSMIKCLNQELRPLQDGVYIGKMQTSESTLQDGSKSYLRCEPWQTTEIGITSGDADCIVIQFGGYCLGIALTEPSYTMSWGSTQAETSIGYKSTSNLNSFDGKARTASIMASDYYKDDDYESYAVAYCYKYSTSRTASDGSKEEIAQGNWWLPAMGDLALISQHLETINLALQRLKDAGKQSVDLLQQSYYWSCCEYSGASAWILNFKNGNRGINSKVVERALVRPVTALGAGASNGITGNIIPFDTAKNLTSQDEREDIASAWSIRQLYNMINTIDVTDQLSSYLTIASAKATYQPIGDYAAASHNHDSVYSKLGHTHNYANTVKVGTTSYNVSSNIITIPAYPTTLPASDVYAWAKASTKPSYAWSEITSKPTTLSGYGITDGVNAVSATGSGNAVTSASISGHTLTLTKGSTFSLSSHTHTFASLTSKPTTIDGYGITDAYTKTEVDDEVTAVANRATTLEGYFTSGSAKTALQLTNARKLWGNSFNGTADVSGSIVVPSGNYISIGNIKLEYDSDNKALKITNTTTSEVANLYTSGGVTAYGVGTGSSGGGGLNGTIIPYATAIASDPESEGSKVASASSIYKLHSRISAIETNGATNIAISGTGNAITGVSKDGNTVTYSKDVTFLTSHQSLADYVNAISVTGTGNAVTAISKSGNTLTITKGTYLTSHQSLADYYTSAQVDSIASGKSATSHTHSVKINGVTKTIAASGGTAVDLGTYLTSHQSLSGYATESWVQSQGYLTAHQSLDSYLTKTDAASLYQPKGSYAAASHTHTYIVAQDRRSNYPGAIVGSAALGVSFMYASTLGISGDGSYYDAVIVRSYRDSTGGADNALLFSKNSNSLYHTQFSFGSTTSWGTPIKIWDTSNLTKVSQLTNDSGYLTTHQDISGKVNYSDVFLGSSANSGMFAKIPRIGTDGVIELGKYIDMHYDNTTNIDYATRLECTGNYGNWIYLPSANGTLALTSQIPTSLKNPNALSWSGYSSGSYDGSSAQSISIPNNTNQLTNGAGYITSSGNCSYASSAGNADTVDGRHETAFMRTLGIMGSDWNDNVNAGCYKVQNPSANTPGNYNYGMGLTLATENHNDGENRVCQIYFSHVSDYAMAVRTHNGDNSFSSDWTPWAFVPTTNGNIASATKLQTARTIWGQSFDGTGDVSGNMTGVGNINTSSSPAGTIYTSNWFRSTGTSGWYSETYGGGWYMTDTTYIRAFGNKSIYTGANILAAGGITAYQSSDARLKRNIQSLSCLNVIKSIGGVYEFDYLRDGNHSIGFIAQRVNNPLLADIVDKDDDGYLKINYWSPKLISLAFGAITEVDDEIGRLKDRVRELENEVEQLKSK